MKKNSVLKVSFLVLMSVLCLLVSYFQVFGESPDYSQYGDYFDLVKSERDDIFTVSRFEPGFSAVSLFFIIVFSGNAAIYSAFVFFATAVKAWVISNYAASKVALFAAFAFYFFRYFPLHELTQLRAACAMSFVLIGAHLVWKKKTFSGIVFSLVALFFHFSSAALLPALFLKADKRWFVVSISFLVFCVASVFSNAVAGYFSNFIAILDSYQNNGFGDVKPNPFALQLLIDWFFIFISMLQWSKLTEVMKRVILLQLIGLGFFYGALDFAVIAHRIREFYSVFWLFFVAEGLVRRETQGLTFSMAMVSIFYYAYVFIFSGDFFH